jgi:hypothetical protein
MYQGLSAASDMMDPFCFSPPSPSPPSDMIFFDIPSFL